MKRIIIIGAVVASMATMGIAQSGCTGVGDGSSGTVDTSSDSVVENTAFEKNSIFRTGKAPSYDTTVTERIVEDLGNRTIRAAADSTISNPTLMKNRKNAFILISKKDFYLYVYEPQGNDTVMLARYDVCLSLKKGDKQRRGDMRTPSCSMKRPFTISQIVDASTWKHDFGDGRGSIKSYGNWFMRLVTPGHSGIGIHGSTNNRQSVPGRASEGCIRLKDEDIIDLKKNYASVGMKVVIKDEAEDDLPFEITAHERQAIKRVRHFDPATTLTNEQIARATDIEKDRVKSNKVSVKRDSTANPNKVPKGKNMTLEQLRQANKKK